MYNNKCSDIKKKAREKYKENSTNKYCKYCKKNVKESYYKKHKKTDLHKDNKKIYKNN
jgi:hypothetical protein